jgi:ubiquinone/menaquinone biosynthesis C-methylase UbiE
LPIDDESIDFVTDRGLFHLIEDPNRPTYSAELYRVLKNERHALIRGARKELGHDQFNPVSEEAIDKYFPTSKFKRGLVLPIPLFSVEGLMDGRIVMLQKIGRF